ncbi:MAG TPA: hypothetical protein VLA88_04795 [Candidatus Saccharimonadales bacterium]|nr:hypothetical protein [Candidatus Saccharimonadales bacterium]
MERKKLILACIAVTLAALAILAIMVFALNRSASQPANGSKEVTISGHLACLKHKGAADGQPVTLECATGLLADDQQYYGLQDLPTDAAATSFNKTIVVSGRLSLPDADEIYDVAGNLKVTSFEVK